MLLHGWQAKLLGRRALPLLRALGALWRQVGAGKARECAPASSMILLHVDSRQALCLVAVIIEIRLRRAVPGLRPSGSRSERHRADIRPLDFRGVVRLGWQSVGAGVVPGKDLVYQFSQPLDALPQRSAITPYVLLYILVCASCGERQESWVATVKLWRLLDVASAAEPERSQQRANVRELESWNPRQLGGVVVEVALATRFAVGGEGRRDGLARRRQSCGGGCGCVG